MLSEMFLKYFQHMPNGHMLRTLGHFGYILITLAHCKCVQHEPNFFHFDQHVIFGCMLGTFEEESWKHLKCFQNVSGGKGLSKLDQCFQCIHNVITGFHRPLPPVSQFFTMKCVLGVDERFL